MYLIVKYFSIKGQVPINTIVSFIKYILLNIMPLFNVEQLEKIYKILNLDEGYTVNKLYETRKNNEKSNQIKERRPSWSSNTTPIKKPLMTVEM